MCNQHGIHEVSISCKICHSTGCSFVLYPAVEIFCVIVILVFRDIFSQTLEWDVLSGSVSFRIGTGVAVDGEKTAFVKRKAGDACYCWVECDAFKFLAVLERFITDLFQLSSSGHFCQASTVLECIIPDLRYAVWDLYFC